MTTQSKLLLISALTISVNQLASQDIFPGLTDEALIEALADAYKPSAVLTLSQAKDTLYAVIDNEMDSVSGIYSDFTLHLPSGTDPSQWVFMNGDGINLEHSWPRSKGAGEGTQGHSDMHHLFPTRVAVNSARASNPFDEIPDNETTTWFFRDQAQSSVPASNIDAYSEATKTAFEPRESVKGDIARAAFYFYTMYKAEADAADPIYFEAQRSTFLGWHHADPVDTREMERSALIAGYQDGKENPFVLDPTLADRAYCDDPPCTITSSSRPESTVISHRVEGCTLMLESSSEVARFADVTIWSIDGRRLGSSRQNGQGGSKSLTVGLCDLPAGIYLARVRSVGDHGKVLASTIRFSLNR